MSQGLSSRHSAISTKNFHLITMAINKFWYEIKISECISQKAVYRAYTFGKEGKKEQNYFLLLKYEKYSDYKKQSLNFRLLI